MGNICRSPMAEGILTTLIKKDNLKAVVDSAGTIGFHEGEAPDRRAQKKALQHGVDISHIVSRPFKLSDFDDFDWIYVMDYENYKDILSRTSLEKHKAKVKFILDEVFPQQNLDVPDPYYGGEQGFENVFQMLMKASVAIAKKIKNNELR